eukprot:jgi/Picsp_1/4776/NSC_02144-R1_achain the three-dimensional structure and x-ray sequence reveal that trichomaglin is a novel s-like ribonuclease
MKILRASTLLRLVVVIAIGLKSARVSALRERDFSSPLAGVEQDMQEFKSVHNCNGRCSRTLQQERNSTSIQEPSEALQPSDEPTPEPIQEVLDFQLEMDWNPSSCYGYSTCEESKQVNAFTISEMTVRLDENGARNIKCMDEDSQEAKDLRVTNQLSQGTLSAVECILGNSAGENEDLWKDVYVTEGSCTGLPVSEYFDMVVKLYTEVNLNKIIYDMGVINGTSVVQKEVDRDTLLNAVSNAVGKKAWIACDPEIKMLRYVQVCVNPEPPYDIIDCIQEDPLAINDASCDKKLTLPTIPSGGYVSEECRQYNPYGVSRSGDVLSSSAATSFFLLSQTLATAICLLLFVIHGSNLHVL